MNTRICCKCKETKPCYQNGYCKECMRAYNLERYIRKWGRPPEPRKPKGPKGPKPMKEPKPKKEPRAAKRVALKYCDRKVDRLLAAIDSYLDSPPCPKLLNNVIRAADAVKAWV